MHRYIPLRRNSYRSVPFPLPTLSSIPSPQFLIPIPLPSFLLVGQERYPAGRVNEAPSLGLSASLHAAGFDLGRLQTGTPARLVRRSIDFSGMSVFGGDRKPSSFSYLQAQVDNAVSDILLRLFSGVDVLLFDLFCDC